MKELISGNEHMYIMIYCLLILWVNVGYLKERNVIKKEINDISSEQELDIDPNSVTLIVILLIFNFFRSWLIYLFAATITGNVVVSCIALILFVIGLYDSLFNSSFTKVKESNLRFYLIVIDTIFIAIFVVYLFVTMS